MRRARVLGIIPIVAISVVSRVHGAGIGLFAPGGNEPHQLGRRRALRLLPGQGEAAERGVWRVEPKPLSDPESRLYAGNRAHVDLAAVTNAKGAGVGFLGAAATISLEETGEGRVFSHILKSAGKGNKTGGMLTLLPIPAKGVKSVKGPFRLLPLEPGKWPSLFQDSLSSAQSYPKP